MKKLDKEQKAELTAFVEKFCERQRGPLLDNLDPYEQEYVLGEVARLARQQQGDLRQLREEAANTKATYPIREVPSGILGNVVRGSTPGKRLLGRAGALDAYPDSSLARGLGEITGAKRPKGGG